MLLSGRTGRPLWIAGPLPLDFEAHGYSQIHWAKPQVVEPNAAPDVLVRHDSPFLAASPTPPPPNSPAQDRLARVSGRTGRIVWDIPLGESGPGPRVRHIPPPAFHDLDGDGVPRRLVVLPTAALVDGTAEYELKAVSLRDGRLLWSQPIRRTAVATSHHVQIVESDEAKAGRSWSSCSRTVRQQDVIVWSSGRSTAATASRSGPGTAAPEYPRQPAQPVTMETARLEGGSQEPALRRLPGIRRQAADRGPRRRRAGDRRRHRRDVPGEHHQGLLRAVDLDGDGRDELLVWHADRLRAWGRDLKELWSWPDQAGDDRADPPGIGRPAGGRDRCSSGLGLDGTDRAPAMEGPARAWRGQFAVARLLDPGDSDASAPAGPHPQGATICRSAMPAAPRRHLRAAPRHRRCRPGLARDDPRWTRPLALDRADRPPVWALKGFRSCVGLALVNVMVPLGILRLAARRRPWTVRALMALPVAAAVPLWVFQTFEPLIPTADRLDSGLRPAGVRPGHAGGPADRVYAGNGRLEPGPRPVEARWPGWSGSRSSPRPLAAAWLWADSRTMPAIEHYGRSGWYLVIVPGAYATGFLLLGASFATLITLMLGGYRTPSRSPRSGAGTA